MIYFDRDTQNLALKKFHKLLANTGLLFLGHAETPDYLRGNFTRAEYVRSFSYNKTVNNSPEIKEKIRSAETPTTTKKTALAAPRTKPRTEFLETVPSSP